MTALDLDLHPLVLNVGLVGWLGHDAVEPGAFEAIEPVAGRLDIGRARGQEHGRLELFGQGVESRLALAQCVRREIGVAQREKIERDIRRRSLDREPVDP